MEMTIDEIKNRIEAFVPKQHTLFEMMRVQGKELNELIYEICMAFGKDGEVDMASAEGDYDLVITYDGGNHPEYASNICSTVYSVKAEVFTSRLDGSEVKAFSVRTEDTPKYEYNRIMFDDKDAIFDALVGKFNL